jgi:hypothetical protein
VGSSFKPGPVDPPACQAWEPLATSDMQPTSLDPTSADKCTTTHPPTVLNEELEPEPEPEPKLSDKPQLQPVPEPEPEPEPEQEQEQEQLSFGFHSAVGDALVGVVTATHTASAQQQVVAQSALLVHPSAGCGEQGGMNFYSSDSESDEDEGALYQSMGDGALFQSALGEPQ